MTCFLRHPAFVCFHEFGQFAIVFVIPHFVVGPVVVASAGRSQELSAGEQMRGRRKKKRRRKKVVPFSLC